MSDQRSVMKEFRFLDEKRLAQGLTPAEEARYAHLRDLIGPDLGASGLRPGFDVDAAAARLRDSLLPAGLRNRPPPPPPAAPEPAAEDLYAADALASAYAAEAFAAQEPVQPDASFDPASLAPDAAQPYDPAAQAGDLEAGAAWSAAETAAWDPNDPNAAAWDPKDPNAQAWDPNAAAPNSSAPPYEGEAAPGYDPNDPNAQAAWDAGSQQDPAAANAPYDPNAPFDPNAGYDPNVPYDPNAAYDPAAPGFDPNAAYAEGYDPAAQAPEGAFDPAAPPLDLEAPQADAAPGYDPDAPAVSDPNASYDPNAPYDPGAVYDPNALVDPAAQPFDASAGPDSGAQGYPAPAEGEVVAEGEPLAAGELVAEAFDADAPPAGWFAEPAASVPPEGSPLGEYDEAASAPPLEDAGLESALPFDLAAAAAITPGEVPEGFGSTTGDYDDTAGFAAGDPDLSPADLPQDGSGFQAAQAVEPEATAEWQPEAVIEEGFQLASGGSFDAAADAAAPEWAGGTAPPPWENAPETGEADAFALPEAPLSPAAEPFEGVADAPQPETSDLETFAEPPQLVEPLAPDADLAETVLAAENLEQHGEAFADRALGAVEESPLAEEAVSADDFTVYVDAEPDGSLAPDAASLDFSRQDLSAGAPSPEEAAFVAAATEPPADATLETALDMSLEAAAEPSALDLGANVTLAFDLPPASSRAPAALAEDEMPTIEGEDILEEIPLDEVTPAAAAETELEPPPWETSSSTAFDGGDESTATELPRAVIAIPPPAGEPAPAVNAIPVAPPPPPPPPEPAASAEEVQPPEEPQPGWHVPGVHRVVVHTVEGQVKRGVLEDVDLDAAYLGLVAQPGQAAEAVPTEKVKAIFFMLAPGENSPAPEGKKVRVTFRDGRQVAGFSPDYRETGVGFFMIPVDTRTSTGRIWVYRSAVRQVAVS